MSITLSWQSVTAAAAIIGAVVAVVSYLRKLFGWFERQEKQEKEIKAIKDEQAVLVYGLLACLKGLHEGGANGPVTEAITTLEKHINEEAHKHET